MAAHPSVVVVEARRGHHPVVRHGGAGIVHLQQEAGVDDGAVFRSQRFRQGDHEFFFVPVVFVLSVRDGAGGSCHREECFLHLHALQRRFQVVDVMLKFGEARVFHWGDANRFLLRYVGPGAIVSTFELRVKLLEALPVRASGKRIGARFDRAHLEAAHALQSVERPTGGLAEFAVVDDVDARLSLPAHDFGDGFLEALLVGAHICGIAFFPRAHEFEQPRRADQAANMRCQNSI